VTVREDAVDCLEVESFAPMQRCAGGDLMRVRRVVAKSTAKTTSSRDLVER
jgi:hypothetical protein